MPEPEPMRQAIRSQGRVASTSRLDTRQDSTYREEYSPVEPRRPNMGRSSTFQGPTAMYRESPSVPENRKTSIPNDVGSMRAQLRPANRVNTGGLDVFGDPSDDSTLNSASPDRSYGARSVSPATSHGSVASRTAPQALTTAPNGRKGPPPPPPSRNKKPPPPLPMKRADMSATSVNRY